MPRAPTVILDRGIVDEPAPVVLPSERARVLVVDDDEHNLVAISNVLEDLAEIVVARSGEEALRHLLREWNPISGAIIDSPPHKGGQCGGAGSSLTPHSPREGIARRLVLEEPARVLYWQPNCVNRRAGRNLLHIAILATAFPEESWCLRILGRRGS